LSVPSTKISSDPKAVVLQDAFVVKAAIMMEEKLHGDFDFLRMYLMMIVL
jgi:hypothetical protein